MEWRMVEEDRRSGEASPLQSLGRGTDQGPAARPLAGPPGPAQAPAGENWPHWRGPAGNGVATETNLPTTWGVDTNVAWKVEMPAWTGSTPIIWRDHVFLNVADGTNISLWCLDRANGAVRWTRELSDGDRRARKQNMSSPSPVTNGEHVYVMTGTGVLTAFDFEGRQLWMRDIQALYGAFGLNWGYASSPLLVDDGIYVQVVHGMRTDDPSYLLRIIRIEILQ